MRFVQRHLQQNVERSNLLSPLDFEALLNPFTVLVDHGVNDVDERLVAVEQTVSSREDVTLQPALSKVSITAL